MADSKTDNFSILTCETLLFYIKLVTNHRAASATTKKNMHSSVAEKSKTSASSSTNNPTGLNTSCPTPWSAYKEFKNSTPSEPQESQGKVAADLPTISDTIQGLLDLQKGSPGAVNPEEVDVLSSMGEEEVGELTKRKRTEKSDKEEQKDDGSSSNLSDDEEDEGTEIELTPLDKYIDTEHRCHF